MTDAERKLWALLRRDRLGVRFRRQHPVGPYTLDFYCPEILLAIEVDGGQHGALHRADAERRRTAWLSAKGIRVVRFWNNDVLGNQPGVLEDIAKHVSAAIDLLRPPRLDPLPHPPPCRGRVSRRTGAEPAARDGRVR